MAVWSQVRFSTLPADMRFDAEYYQPEYLHQADTITRGPHKRIADIAQVSDGNHMAISEKFCEQGVRYLRGQDLSDFFISDTDPLYIPQNEYAALSRSHMRQNDVLVGIVGTIGSVGLVTDRHGQLTGNCKLAILRPKAIEPEFLAAYLFSHVGQNEIRRRIRGTVQMGLILPDLKNIPVPTLPQERRSKIASLVREAYNQRTNSLSLYAQAESVLLKELGLDKLDASPVLCYERRFSETRQAGRFDAEFYQPKYARVIKELEKTKPDRIAILGDFLQFLTNGHTPLHHDLSLGEVPFLTAEHVYDFRIDYASEKRILKEHHNGELKRTRLRNGDMLITIKGRIGNAAIAEGLPSQVNINQDVALFRLKEDLPPYYLLALLNSPAGKAFTEQYCTGQINPFLGLGNLKLLPVPVYKPQRMEAIARKTKALVASARNAREESIRLLDKAKSMVEKAVLEN